MAPRLECCPGGSEPQTELYTPCWILICVSTSGVTREFGCDCVLCALPCVCEEHRDTYTLFSLLLWYVDRCVVLMCVCWGGVGFNPCFVVYFY